jgi:hypothetical protein
MWGKKLMMVSKKMSNKKLYRYWLINVTIINKIINDKENKLTNFSQSSW